MEFWTHLFYYIGCKRKHETIEGGVAPTLEKACEIRTVPEGGAVRYSSCAGLFWLFYEDAEKYLNEQVPENVREYMGVFHAIAVIPVMSPVTGEVGRSPYHFDVTLTAKTAEELAADEAHEARMAALVAEPEPEEG